MKYTNKLEELIKKHGSSPEERDELWKIVEEIVHHRVVGCILDNLPQEHHTEFLGKISDKSFNDELFEYVSAKSGKRIEPEIKREIENIEQEILKDLK
jgi:hypothetical protein